MIERPAAILVISCHAPSVTAKLSRCIANLGHPGVAFVILFCSIGFRYRYGLQFATLNPRDQQGIGDSQYYWADKKADHPKCDETANHAGEDQPQRQVCTPSISMGRKKLSIVPTTMVHIRTTVPKPAWPSQ